MKSLSLLIFLLPIFAFSQSISEKADQLLSAYSEQQKFSGNVLIARDGEILFEKAYGYADRKNGKVNDIETEFRIGSLTKMFTSTLIHQLAEESLLSVNDPISKFVPGFQDGKSITINHLLTHTSGIKGRTNGEPKSLEESISMFKTEPLAFTPGSQFQYNNFNYLLLSYIAEKVTGASYATLVEKRILRKAGMDHSGIDKNERQSTSKANGYITNPETANWEVANGGNVSLASGAGAMYSTIRDLYKWSLAISKKAILPGSTLSEAMTPVHNNYGRGWMITEANGRRSVGHTGSIPGFIANFITYPKENITIILLSNYQDIDGRKLSKDLTSVVFGEPYTIPVVKHAVNLPAEVLSKYAGDYKLENGFTITLSTEGNKLYALAQGDAHRIELTPESEKKFFLKGPETEIEFMHEGENDYMFVNMNGGQNFRKVK